MRFYLLVLFFSLSYSSFVLSYVDLSLNFSHNRRVFVDETIVDENNNKAISTEEEYILNWAWYIWEYTALELNYSQTTTKLVDNRIQVSSDGNVTFFSSENMVFTQVSGAGLRQSFANRNAVIIPSISVGFAKVRTSGSKKIMYQVTGDTPSEVEIEQDVSIVNSGYAAFSLRFRFTQLFGITLVAKSVAPDFDTSQAQNNMTYAAGLSWIF